MNREDTAPDRLADSINIAAHMMTPELKVGQTYEILIELSVEKGLSVSASGIPAPLLQIDTPPSVELVGKVITEYNELALNEFLQAPYERILKELPAKVEFKLIGEPSDGESIGLIFTGYVSSEDGKKEFLRRRLELPVQAAVSAQMGDSRNSHWGTDPQAIKIGDLAPDFSLPRIDGSELSLSHYLGDKNILLTTYRAYW